MPKTFIKLPSKSVALKNAEKFFGFDISMPIDEDSLDNIPPGIRPLALAMAAFVQAPVATIKLAAVVAKTPTIVGTPASLGKKRGPKPKK